MNNLSKVVTQQRRGRASNPRLLDRKSDALLLSHRATTKPPRHTVVDIIFDMCVTVQHADSQFTTYISYLEIYNENGYDLLDPKHEAAKLDDLP